MDFGCFILFGLLGLFTLFWLFFTLVSFDNKHPRRMAHLTGFGISVGLFLVSGLFLYKVYYLDEGFVGAAIDRDAAEVKFLLSRGADPNARWEDGKTALQKAQAGGHKDVVQLLRKAGVSA